MTLGLIPEFMNTSALRYFYEVASSGSFRGAAEKIHIAPSAISRQIQLLETELGVTLFERARKGVRLTAAGEALLHRVRRTMAELAAARVEIGALQGPHHGHVALGVNETVAREFLTDFLARFHASYPGITFAITVGNTADLIDLVLRGDVELMVGYNVPDHSGLERIASFTLDTCIMVRKDHRLAERKWVNVSDLVEDELVLPDETSSLRQVLNAMFARAAARPATIVTTNSFELMANMVAAGLGIGAQVRLSAGRDNVRPDILYVPLRDAEIRPAVLACCLRAGRAPSAAAATCAQQLGEALEAWSRGGAGHSESPPL